MARAFTFERITANNIPPDWHDRVIVLWVEDDATRSDPSAEHIAQAWERFTKIPYRERSRFERGPLDEWDGGDCAETVYEDGWVIGVTPEGHYLGRVVSAAEDRRITLAKEAITYVLSVAQGDPKRLGHHLGPFVESWERLIAAECAFLGLTGQEAAAHRAKRGKSTTIDKRPTITKLTEAVEPIVEYAEAFDTEIPDEQPIHTQRGWRGASLTLTLGTLRNLVRVVRG